MEIRPFGIVLCKVGPPRATDLARPPDCFDDFSRDDTVDGPHASEFGVIDRQRSLDIPRLYTSIIHAAGEEGALDPGQILAISIFNTLCDSKFDVGNLDLDRLDRNSKVSGCLEPAVAERLRLAGEAGAVALKVSLGHYRDECDLEALRPLLAQGPALLVENDQTAQGGRVEPLLRCFRRAAELGLPLAMTFDIGNWHWQGESPQQAARLLGPWVRYVHCKAVRRREDGRLVAIAPQPADLDEWEALLARFAPGVPRAIEYPLAGDDLASLTREQVAQLAQLGRAAEVRHG